VTFLVDANVLSEGTKPVPELSVLDWLVVNESELAVDPIILGEIQIGILVLPKGAKRQRLERWFEDGVRKILCLPWDANTAMRWARLVADLRTAGKAMSVKDSMIAATALVHDLTMVTRNERDFKSTGLNVVNPFE